MNKIKVLISLIPFISSIYVLYLLDKHGIWMPEDLHRDKISILILFMGMAFSFLLLSSIQKR